MAVMRFLRLALPSDIAAGPTTLSAGEVHQLLRASHAWFPESAWLFG